MPDARGAHIFAAVDERRRVVGFAVLQTVVHFEPVFVYPEHRGRDIPALLERAAESHLSARGGGSYFVTIEGNPSLVATAERVGFVHVPGALLRKDVPALVEEDVPVLVELGGAH
jgi:GNAT superfamily N-acetyltransferase